MEINYSENIAKYAKSRGIKIKDLMESVGVSLSTYYTMRDKNQFSTLVLEKIAGGLNVEVSDLVKSKDSKNTIVEDYQEVKDVLKKFEDKHVK